ncbi:hypothetical protein C8Q78DRAFT_1023775 [Trametes maxima]|nr:hypothetical protein C8Q78DRAFT_1023775 [Trametes maxima]
MNCSDSKDGFDPVLKSYRVLCCCCLVCQAWLPRSRLNLYSVVILQDYYHVEQLLYSLASHPFLADHAHTLVVAPGFFPTHIPFARSEIVLQLHNVKNLVICVDWKLYPPHYVRLLAAYASVTSLSIWGSYKTPQDIHRIYRLFKNVGYMHIGAHERKEGTWHTRADAVLKAPRKAYLTLSKLRIGERLLPSACFPSWLTLMDSLTELTLDWNSRWFKDSENDTRPVLDFVSSRHLLKTLTLCIASTTYNYTFGEDGQALSTWIVSAITRTRTHTNLRRICLRFWAPGVPWGTEPGMSRYDFLRRLFTESLLYCIEGIPENRVLAFEIGAIPGDGGTHKWWDEEIRNRLVQAKARITVELMPRPEPGALQIYEWPLWIPWEDDCDNIGDKIRKLRALSIVSADD